jgi:hypothetical protein
MQESKALASAVEKRLSKVFHNLCIKEFVEKSLHLIEVELKYFSFYLYPNSDDERNLSDLACKTLLGLIQAALEQGLQEAFFNEYLGCTQQELIKLVLKDSGMRENTKAAYLSMPLPSDELEIAHATLSQILKYFSIVTMDLQCYLNEKLHQ